MEKTLTVSIAAYNVQDYIENTINSLLVDEIVDDLEILVCDDGGTDSTSKIVEEYEKKYPNSVKMIHKKNGGYGSVINYNVQIATGKYFKQLDGDDWFKSDYLIDYVNFLKSSDADYIISPVIEFNEDTKNEELKNRFSEFSKDVNLSDCDLKNFSTMHESTFKTKLLKDMNMNITEHCFYTDTEYVISTIPYIKTISFFQKPIYVYRIGRDGQSVSVEGIQKHYKDHEKVFWKNLQVYKSLEGNKKRFVLYRLKKELATHCKYYCLLPISIENFKEFKMFWIKINQNCPDILKETINYSRFVKLHYYTRCYFYFFSHFVLKD